MKRFFAILFPALLAAGTVVAAPPVTVLNANRALKLAESRFEKFGQNLTARTIKCVTFSALAGNQQDPSSTSVEIREKHDKKCGGDPMESPLLVTLKVTDSQVFVLDLLSGEYLPWDANWKPSF